MNEVMPNATEVRRPVDASQASQSVGGELRPAVELPKAAGTVTYFAPSRGECAALAYTEKQMHAYAKRYAAAETKRADALQARVAELERRLFVLFNAASGLRFDAYELEPSIAAQFDGKSRILVASYESDVIAHGSAVKAERAERILAERGETGVGGT